MNPKASKLIKRFGIALDIAQALVAAGYGSLGSIRQATLSDLRKVKGIGRAMARRLKQDA